MANDTVPDEAPTDGEQVEAPADPTAVNIAIKYAYKGDASRIVKAFEDAEDPYNEVIQDQIHVRSEKDDGKTPLDVAAMLGRTDYVKQLIERGVDVNVVSCKGYTALHRAAAWGKIEALKPLVEAGIDLQLKTASGERAREVALRYNQTECVDYLDWAEAKVALLDAIKNLRETVADPEKVQGRLTKDDKNVSLTACNEKQDWVDVTTDATTQDFILQRQELDEVLAPVWIKLTEPPPEKPEKK
ncbi:ankyrin repeat domain-containing protein 45-like isoform X2 [Lineus longissimus]|uniref:ankyrin repeat domain-containing protein 45-like isoform X2 n=1 Tax=Lineus longissimus TaxID=88925 RepID=UPI00315D6CBB